MATYFRDFTEYSDGQLGTVGSADWTVTEGNATWTETVGSGVCVFANNGAGEAVTKATFDAVNTTGDLEIYARLKHNSIYVDNASLIGPALIDSTNPSYCLYVSSASTVRLVRTNTTGGLAAYVDVAQSFTLVADTYFKVRIGRSGTTIRAKIWADGDGEPGTWNAGSGTETTLTTLKPGFLTNAYSPCPYTFDDVGIGSAGDSAPTSDSGGFVTAWAINSNQVIQ